MAKKQPVRKVTLPRGDPADNLKSEADIAAYFDAAMAEAGDDPAFIAAVLGDIAKARGIMAVAQSAGLTRGGLYKALAPDAKPSLQTVQKIAKALGFKIVLERAA